jgi:hypothetical protein
MTHGRFRSAHGIAFRSVVRGARAASPQSPGSLPATIGRIITAIRNHSLGKLPIRTG